MQQQRASSVRALCSVQVTSLLSTLRGNRKFQDSLLLPPWEEADGLTKLLNHLRHKLATGDHVTDSELFYPFLQVVRAKEVSGLATHKALEGILNMLRAHPWDCSILRQVAEAVEQCKFEETMRVVFVSFSAPAGPRAVGCLSFLSAASLRNFFDCTNLVAA